MTLRTLLLLFLLAGLAQAGTTPPSRTQISNADSEATDKLEANEIANSVIRVNSTNQEFNFRLPWSKKPNYERRGLGVIVGENRVLINAQLIANHSDIELEEPTGGSKSKARIVCIDYDSDLALLEAIQPDFLSKKTPLKIAPNPHLGDSLEVLQLENNGELIATPAKLTRITTAGYAIDDIAMLVFRLALTLQQRDGSFVLPAIQNGKLLGMLIRYDRRNQSADAIPAPIINRFLELSKEKTYSGFPRAGFGIAMLRDPQLRNYLKMGDKDGIYIDKISPDSPADKAGLQVGDVLLAVNGYNIDNEANYIDPDFGRMPIIHLTTGKYKTGETLDFHILRDGKELDIPVTLTSRDRDHMTIPIQLFDKSPRYTILGGILFQELSRPYLKEWGNDWKNNAPAKLVYYDEMQEEELKDHKALVFIAQILPLSETLGLNSTAGSPVTKADGQNVESLEDLINAVKNSKERYVKIEIEADPKVLYIDKQAEATIEATIKNKFGIQKLQQLDE
ncbi:MAG: PDZ domain-containing protein [Chthoniobacterales bacterium]